MDKDLALSLHYKDHGLTHTPEVIPKKIRVDVLKSRKWCEHINVVGNYQRSVRIFIEEIVGGVRYTLIETHGAKESRLYGFYVRSDAMSSELK